MERVRDVGADGLSAPAQSKSQNKSLFLWTRNDSSIFFPEVCPIIFLLLLTIPSSLNQEINPRVSQWLTCFSYFKLLSDFVFYELRWMIPNNYVFVNIWVLSLMDFEFGASYSFFSVIWVDFLGLAYWRLCNWFLMGLFSFQFVDLRSKVFRITD